MSLTQWMQAKKEEGKLAPTRGEMAMKFILTGMKIHYIEQKVNTRRGVKRIYDFFVPRFGVVIEVDGGYHTPEIDKPKNDEINNLFLEWRIIRFTNDEVLDNPRKVEKQLKFQFLENHWSLSSEKVKHKPNANKALQKGLSKKAVSMLKHRKVLN